MALRLIPNKSIATNLDRTTKVVDLTLAYIDDLKATYREVEIAVRDDVLGYEYTLLASDCAPLHTLVENVIAHTPLSIFKPGAPKLDLRMSLYRPLQKSFNTIKLCGLFQHPTQPVDPADVEDIYVADIRDVGEEDLDNCLFTTNGFFVRGDSYLQGKRLVGAGSMIRREGSTAAGVLIMPCAVKCHPVNAAECEFTEDGQLYVKDITAGKNTALVIAGRLFVSGLDDELRRIGPDFSLFSFDLTFILDWVIRHKDKLGFTFNSEALSPAAMMQPEFKRLILDSKYTFLVELDGDIYRDGTAVGGWWVNELRHINNKDTSDFYGLVQCDDGRVVDYWGVYSEYANILYSALNKGDLGKEFYAHGNKYQKDPVITDKRKLVPAEGYGPKRVTRYCKRV